MAFLRIPNQQDLSWFIDMREQKRLELDPIYQRKSVWTYKDKQFFLDTVLNNFPCPAIYLQKESTDKGPLFNVVDGKQRLSTILDFYDGKIRLSKSFSIPNLVGKKFVDLPDERKTEFFNYVFMVEQIRSEHGAEVDWSEVFQRVNRNQKKLTEQELRHARFDGWLIKRAEKEVSENSLWKNIGVSSKARNARMKDVEFVSVLMLVILENDFVGFPQDNIDELYAKYDFNLEELPEDEVAISLEDDDVEFDGITKETIADFEANFTKVVTFISGLEPHNSCVSNHKKRLFTDFYSLWAVVALEASIIALGSQVVAQKYDEFTSKIDDAFVTVKAGGSLEEELATVQIYQAHSTGAATEAESRRSRNQALIDYMIGNDGEN